MQRQLMLVALLVVAVLLVACGSDDPTPTPRPPSQDSEPGDDGFGTAGRAQPIARLIVREGEISLTVEVVADAAKQIEDLTVEFDGWVQSSSIRGAEGREEGSVSVRVPVARFREFLDAAKAFAVRVDSENTTSQDVTEEFVDLDAQARNLRVTEAQFQVLMEQATTVRDILTVQSELTDVRDEIERMEGRMNFLQQSASESKATFTLRPVKNEAPLIDEGWSFTETGKSAIRGLTTVAQRLTDVAVYVGVFAPIWGVVALVVLWLWRRGAFNSYRTTGSYRAPERRQPGSQGSLEDAEPPILRQD